MYLNRLQQHRRGATTAQERWPRGDIPRPRSGAAAALCWSSHKEIPRILGKRNPSKTVGAERGHQREDRLKPQSQTTSQSDHMDHSLVELNEAKPCPVGPQKMVGSWWRSLTECSPLENGKPLQYSCWENPVSCMKRQKERTLEDELPRLVGSQYATGDQWRNNSRKKWRDGAKAKAKPSCGWDCW